MHALVESAVLACRAVLRPLTCPLEAAERLYGARRFTDALAAGQALLTAPATDDLEQARVHAFVARCLSALQAHSLAARHLTLARECHRAPGPRQAVVAPAGTDRRSSSARTAKPLYWPTERRGKR